MVKVLPAQGTGALSGSLVTIRQDFIFEKLVTHCLLSSQRRPVIVSQAASIDTTCSVLFKVVPGIERKLSGALSMAEQYIKEGGACERSQEGAGLGGGWVGDCGWGLHRSRWQFRLRGAEGRGFERGEGRGAGVGSWRNQLRE